MAKQDSADVATVPPSASPAHSGASTQLGLPAQAPSSPHVYGVPCSVYPNSHTVVQASPAREPEQVCEPESTGGTAPHSTRTHAGLSPDHVKSARHSRGVASPGA